VIIDVAPAASVVGSMYNREGLGVSLKVMDGPSRMA
jgi:hypothetical protein